ncbi:MAG: NADH-quinone oxidoreductase subunit C [Chloroflexota bacterium]
MADAPQPHLELVDRSVFGAVVARQVTQGDRYRTLVATDERSLGGDGLALEAVLDGTLGRQRVRTLLPLEDPSYPSLAQLGPAAHGDEREAQDLLGVVAVDHPDPRRLVLHDTWPEGHHPLRKDVPADVAPPAASTRFQPFAAEGRGVYQLPVGPIHAGVIEPGHFRFSAVGERVLHLDARLFFTHRGLEKLAEGRSLVAALALVERACGVCTVTHALAYSQAVEQLTRTRVPERATWGRVLVAELERLYNHVGDLGNICAGIGFHPGSARLGALKERLLRLDEALVGHRYLMGAVVPGGLRADFEPTALAGLPGELAAVGRELADAVRMVIRSDGVVARFHGAGAAAAGVVGVLGGLGVAARAVGIDADLRRDAPYAAYGELAVGPVTKAAGDVAARFDVRAQEAQASLQLIREVLGRLPDGPVRTSLAGEAVAGDVAISGVEGPRGASWLWVRAGQEGTVDRVRLRSASFANWPVVAASVTGDLVPDFPLINKSFELCYACTDR